jgi:hypothetical protein
VLDDGHMWPKLVINIYMKTRTKWRSNQQPMRVLHLQEGITHTYQYQM